MTPADGQGQKLASGESRNVPILTLTELRLLCALEDILDDRQWPPTLAELCVELGWSPKSKSLAHRYLERLRRLGLVTGSGRSLRLQR